MAQRCQVTHWQAKGLCRPAAWWGGWGGEGGEGREVEGVGPRLNPCGRWSCVHSQLLCFSILCDI